MIVTELRQWFQKLERVCVFKGNWCNTRNISGFGVVCEVVLRRKYRSIVKILESCLKCLLNFFFVSLFMVIYNRTSLSDSASH